MLDDNIMLIIITQFGTAAINFEISHKLEEVSMEKIEWFVWKNSVVKIRHSTLWKIYGAISRKDKNTANIQTTGKLLDAMNVKITGFFR